MVRTGHAMTMGDRKSVNESRDGRFNDSFSAVTFVLLEYWKKNKTGGAVWILSKSLAGYVCEGCQIEQACSSLGCTKVW